MAWGNGVCANDSRSVRQFLQEECIWRLVSKGQKHREYRAICCKSAIFSTQDDSSCILCQLILLRRNRHEYIICLNANGKYQGHYSSPRVHRRRRHICHLPPVYQLIITGPLGPAHLDFLPRFNHVVSSMSCRGISPDTMYEVCQVVSEDEAKRVVIKGDGAVSLTGDKAVSLGGTGAWLVVRPEGYVLYFYILCYDLYTSCGNRQEMPSMARLMAAATACGQMGCTFCVDHGGHVDPTGEYAGSVSDHGGCFCYIPCGPMTQSAIHNPEPATFFCEDEKAQFLCTCGSKTAPQITLASGLDYVFGVKDAEGGWLQAKQDVWDLVKVEEPVSRMLVCSCPVLKNLVH
ncbi:tegument protein UL16 [Panine betaherpesvirus 2]|uniref:Tegument protein UL16 n=1 Tax=Panine betaherpesvirus 2 TaxID=188763 RepID=Q8QS06_9BETA|nr:tegument protein UL16 [Panine betaherpesvirus 2]AAM00732.1 tegument protein UL16 [Panine betaherpesvirus 2]QXV67843.1 tegument protein UL16 [Panine betaherpesvirus 2]